MQTIKLLWLLQKIQKKEKELLSVCRSNPLLKELKSYKEKIMQQQKAYENAKNNYQSITQNIKETEAEISAIMEKQKEILKKLYDGSISNSKELGKLQEQSRLLTQKAQKAEEKQLKDMEQKERLYIYLKEQQKLLKKELEDYNTRKMKYDLEKINFEQELAQLGDEKEKLLAQIPEKELKKFREKEGGFAGEPITFVGPNRLCSFCNVEVTKSIVDKSKQNPGKVCCESCGRIIYAE